MAVRPSTDLANKNTVSGFWKAVEPLWDNAISLAPLPRNAGPELFRQYIPRKSDKSESELDSYYSRLPRSFEKIEMSSSELDVIDFILNYDSNRVLVLEGHRGAGKTSLIHFVELAIRKSRRKRGSVFLILDGLRLDDDRGASDLISLASQELRSAINRAPSSWSPALNEALIRLNSAESLVELRDVLVGLVDTVRGIGPKEPERLVVVIDNLDHIGAGVIHNILAFARELYVATGVACVVAMRPNCLYGVYSRGSARAFFSLSITVPPPNINLWISTLGERLADAAIRMKRKNGHYVRYKNVDVGPDEVRTLISELIRCLDGRKIDDDLFQLLEAISAEDIRHLSGLIRRFISSPLMPIDELIEGRIQKDSFHPLPSLFQGSATFFSGDRYIPNALCSTTSTGEHHLLLIHRILSFLEPDPISYDDLVAMLSLLGYPESEAVPALTHLLESLLVRGTTAATCDRATKPEALFLTNAGIHYKSSMLVNSDYLTAAVLDVPLEHAELVSLLENSKHGPDMAIDFSIRLASLLEYTKEVSRREAAQITDLTKAEPSTAMLRVVDALSLGGLFIANLYRALVRLRDRADHSRSARLYKMRPQLAAAIAELMKVRDSLERRLSDLANRARHRQQVINASQEFTINGEMVNLLIEQRGDTQRITATVSNVQPGRPIVVMVAMPGSLGDIRRAAPAFHRPFASQGDPKLNGHLKAIFEPARASNTTNLSSAAIHTLRLPSEDFATQGLLSLDVDSDDVQLMLSVNKGREWQDVEIGRRVSLQSVREVGRDILSSIEAKVLARELESTDIQLAGTRLAKEVLSSAGMNLTMSYLDILQSVVLCCHRDLLGVPWEWIRPEPEVAESTPCIHEKWLISRYQLDERFSRFQDLGIQLVRRAKNFGTIGLKPDKQWRLPTPRKFGEFAELIERYDVLHVVGHFDGAAVIVSDGISTLTLTEDQVNAFPFEGANRSLVLSSCGQAAAESDKNLASFISQRCRAVVWAPLVSILEDQAEALDCQLGAMFGRARSKPVPMWLNKMAGESVGLHDVYVKYGFG